MFGSAAAIAVTVSLLSTACGREQRGRAAPAESTSAQTTPRARARPSDGATSTSPATSASTATVPTGGCATTDVPDAVVATEGDVESVAVVIAQNGATRIGATARSGSFDADLPRDANIAAGKPLPAVQHFQDALYRTLVAPQAIGGELALLTLDMQGYTFRRGSASLTFDQPPATIFYGKRIAIAASGERWLGVVAGWDYDKGPCVLDADDAQCTNGGIYSGRVAPNDPRLTLVRAEVGKLALTTQPFPVLPAQAEARVDSLAVLPSDEAALIVFRSLGEIQLLRVSWKGEPTPMREGGANPKLLVGGDVSTPAALPQADGLLRLVWPQRKKPKGPYSLRTTTARLREDRVGTPTDLVVPEPTTDAVAVAMAASGDGLVIAWLDVTAAGTNVWMGRDASVDAASRNARVVARSSAAVHALAVDARGAEVVLAWSETRAVHVTTASCTDGP